MTMRTRVPIAATLLGLFLVVRPSAGDVSQPREVKTRAVSNAIDAGTSSAASNASIAYSSFRNLADGQFNHDEIQEMLDEAHGDEPAVNWFSPDRKDLSGMYKLSQVTTHILNLDTNLEILVEHNLADDDIRTAYSRLVNGVEASTVISNIVVPKLYNATKNEFDFTSSALYQFHLKSDSIEQNFTFRSPSGAYSLAAPAPSSLNPLGWLAATQATDRLEFTWDDVNGQQYVISITPRATKIDTLTFEITAREVSSLVTTTVVLTYSLM